MNELLLLFDDFEANDVDYCVLRNYEDLLSGETIDDVDILVRRSSQEAIRRICRKRNWQQRPGDTTAQTRFRKYVQGYGSFVTLDFYWGAPTYNGLDLADGERVLDNRRRHEGLWIPCKNDLFVELVFHAILNKNRVREQYQEKLSQLSNAVDVEAVCEHARFIFGSTGVQTVEYVLTGEYEKAVGLKWKLVIAASIKSPACLLTLVYNLIILRELLRPLLVRIRRVNPLDGTPVLAVVGPDGVGKSTVVNGTVNELMEEGYDVSSRTLGIHSGNSVFLKNLRKLYNHAQKNSSEAGTRGGRETLSKPSSRYKTPLLVFDFLIRYLGAQSSEAELIITDRYIQELPVYNQGFHRRIVRLFEPHSFYGVILQGDCEDIGERSEFTPDSIQEFYERLNVINWQRIDVSSGERETVDTASNIAREILEK